MQAQNPKVDPFILRIAAAIAVDMALVRVRPEDEAKDSIQELVDSLLNYPERYAQREQRKALASRILEQVGYSGYYFGYRPLGPPEPAIAAGVALAQKNWYAAINSSITALVDPEEHAGDIWYVRTREEEEDLLDRLHYWAGVWWQEVKDVLAFRGYGDVQFEK